MMTLVHTLAVAEYLNFRHAALPPTGHHFADPDHR